MKFGIQVSGDDPADADRVGQLRNYVERAVAARDAGFDMVAVGHRYSYGPARADERGEPLETSRFQALLVLAHIAATLGDDVDYLTAILLATSANPVQLAEDLATLDAMTGGRLVLGIGLGWLPYEFEAFAVDPKTRARRFEELVEATRALLTQDVVDFDGEFYRYRDARLIARTVQKPTPPLLIGASVDAAVRRAAKIGDGWIMSSHTELSELVRQRALYLDALAEHGKPEPTEWTINRTLYLSEDREEALRQAEPAMIAWYKKRGSWGWDHKDAASEDLSTQGRWVIGSPDDCVEQIETLREQLGVNRINFVTPGTWGQQADRLRTIELFGDRVLPHFRRAP